MVSIEVTNAWIQYWNHRMLMGFDFSEVDTFFEDYPDLTDEEINEVMNTPLKVVLE